MRPVTFLSDYGLADDFVGVCHAVIARIAPEVRVIDLTHGIPRHDIRAGALTLARALPYAPAGVHLAVVDPEVGTDRRAIAIRCAEEQRILVGPDNGLLTLAAHRLGGPVEVVDIARSPHRLEPVAATFHGRDVFAPVAARLATGLSLAAAGEPLATEALTPLVVPVGVVGGGRIEAHALVIDGFGNVGLDISWAQLAGGGLRPGKALLINGREARCARSFADVAAGELLLYEDAYGTPALAVNRGSAAELLGLGPDAAVLLELP